MSFLDIDKGAFSKLSGEEISAWYHSIRPIQFDIMCPQLCLTTSRNRKLSECTEYCRRILQGNDNNNHFRYF